jgi:hypothetical protein
MKFEEIKIGDIFNGLIFISWLVFIRTAFKVGLGGGLDNSTLMIQFFKWVRIEILFIFFMIERFKIVKVVRIGGGLFINLMDFLFYFWELFRCGRLLDV